MNYVLLDTNCWIDFASGKTESKFDFTDSNWRILDKLCELQTSKRLVFLKNEIIDEEFKEAPIKQLHDAYIRDVVENMEKLLTEKVLTHVDSASVRKAINDLTQKRDEVVTSFKSKSEDLNSKVLDLYNTAVNINVPERLKQQALMHSIRKDHPLFKSRKNNVNDFLILYGLQEWIQSSAELKDLDESSLKHSVYLVTGNQRDFGIEKNSFNPEFSISELIKPIRNLNQLVSNISIREENEEDFLPYIQEDQSSNIEVTSIELAIEKLNKLIQLKKEFLLSYISGKLSQFNHLTKVKYIADVIVPTSENFEDGDFSIVRSQDIKGGVLDLGRPLLVKQTTRTSTTLKGDFLIKSVGRLAGEYALNNYDEEMGVHPSVFILRPNTAIVQARFLDYVLKLNPFKNLSKGNWIVHLGLTELKNVQIPLPSIEKQEQLVNILQQKEEEIESQILALKRKINLLLV